jgi:choline kinase
VPRLRFVSNADFRRGASLSLRAARPAVEGERFLLAMADHLFSVELLRRLVASAENGRLVVAADFAPDTHHDVDEATRLRVAMVGRETGARPVTAIGKHIKPYDALDAGAFVLGTPLWDAAESVAEDCELSVIFGALATRGELFAADISGSFWFDVDTEKDPRLPRTSSGARAESPEVHYDGLVSRYLNRPISRPLARALKGTPHPERGDHVHAPPRLRHRGDDRRGLVHRWRRPHPGRASSTVWTASLRG